MSQHRRDVVALPRRTAVQVRAPCMKLGQRLAVADPGLRVPAPAPAEFHEIQLDVVHGQRPAAAPRALEKVLENVDGRLRLGLFAVKQRVGLVQECPGLRQVVADTG